MLSGNILLAFDAGHEVGCGARLWRARYHRPAIYFAIDFDDADWREDARRASNLHRERPSRRTRNLAFWRVGAPSAAFRQRDAGAALIKPGHDAKAWTTLVGDRHTLDIAYAWLSDVREVCVRRL